MRKFLFTITLAYILSMSASAVPQDLFTYENPGFLILTHPEANHRITTSSRMSMLGAANPSYPLYINGEEIPMTANGFFTAYVTLELGENAFTIVNGSDIDYIIITRNEPGPWTPVQTEYYSILLYGSTENNYISRFAHLDDDSFMQTPLARWTTFRILADHGDFYIIEDGTAVFKSNVYQLDYIPSPITISGGEIINNNRCADVIFDVNEYPLYEIEIQDNTARLIIFAQNDEIGITPDNEFITEIDEANTDTEIIRDFTFSESLLGFNVNFTGNTMRINFRFAPLSLSDAVVLLDAGHGGFDPGALGPPAQFGPMEKHFNLYVAEVARDYLEALGVTVIFIREDDSFINIFDRIDYFERYNPDFSVSVHANSMPLSSDFSSAQGPLMFYTLPMFQDVADNMMHIIAAETDNVFMPGVRQNFAMSRYTGAPSFLFEMGFLCNPEDYEIMLCTDYLDRMGVALARAIIAQWGLCGEAVTVPVIAPEPEPIITTAVPQEIVPAIALLTINQDNSYNLNKSINIFAGFTIGILLIGIILFLPNRKSLMKRNK
jgi:N-acetylmuramoyl-L-alanine amidase